jgi:predicted nucleic acid-binding Zn ribbon protein
MSTRTFTKGTYQMLWDCERCDSVGLLGVDHRYCPNCGAPQQAERRYFPDRSQRVETAYVGSSPDWTCERCATPNASPHCVSCGAARGGSDQVEVLAPREFDAQGDPLPSAAPAEGDDAESAETVLDGAGAAGTGADGAGAAGTARPTSKKRRKAGRREARAHDQHTPAGPQTWQQRARWIMARLRRPSRKLVVGAIAAATLLIVAIVLLLTWTRAITMEVKWRTWSHTTALQEWRAVGESEWCSSMPAGAYGVSSSTRLHHYDQVPDGEDCHTEPGGCTQSCSEVDHGNGSFSEVCSESCTPDRQVCTTRYRQVPVYADYCSYTIDRWVELRRETARGTLPTAPTWPQLATHGCDEAAPTYGCERDAHVESQYDVFLRGVSIGAQQEGTTCTVEADAWWQLEEGSRWPLRQRIVTGWIDCRTLRVPSS